MIARLYKTGLYTACMQIRFFIPSDVNATSAWQLPLTSLVKNSNSAKILLKNSKHPVISELLLEPCTQELVEDD